MPIQPGNRGEIVSVIAGTIPDGAAITDTPLQEEKGIVLK